MVNEINNEAMALLNKMIGYGLILLDLRAKLKKKSIDVTAIGMNDAEVLLIKLKGIENFGQTTKCVMSGTKEFTIGRHIVFEQIDDENS